MTLSLDTAYRSFGGEVEASSTPTICRLPDSRRHQLSATAPGDQSANACPDGRRGNWHHANAADRGGFGTRFNSQCCDSAALSRQAVPDPGPGLAADILARRRIQDARKSYRRVSEYYQEGICT